jgi:dTDP-4-dehydrorhamnose reductase
MKILQLGKFGQLGWELERCLQPLGEVITFDYPQIDLTDPQSIRPVIRSIQPHVIVNATAYTAVDRAETESEITWAINALAPGILAEEAARIGAALLHYSTDYVFDGTKGTPYSEDDAPNPLNVYGKSKFAGEKAIQKIDCAFLILRTSWVYSLRRESFVSKVLQWSRQHQVLRLVTDQVGNPTWARMLAEISTQVLVKASTGENPVDWIHQRKGIYHLAGDGWTNRFAWGQAILRHDPKQDEQQTLEIQPALTKDFPSPAERPLFSALNCERFKQTFGLSLPQWEKSLRLAMESTGD